MRLIDADALKAQGYVLTRNYQQDAKTKVIEYKRIDEIPTIDAVRVVRCKDCKHWTVIIDKPQHGACDQWCTLNVTKRDDFCSRGERRNDGEID